MASDLKDLESLGQLVDRASEFHIMLNRLVAGSSAQIIVVDSEGILSYATLGGDATISNAGVLTVGAAAISAPKLEEGVQRITDITITTAELLALFTTPIAVIAAPGANKAIIFEGAVLHKPSGTAYDGIASGEDLSISYTNAAGLEVARVETTGFLDSSGATTRYAHAYQAASAVSSIIPVANAALVIHLLVGNITTGDSDLLLRIYHRVVPTVLT